MWLSSGRACPAWTPWTTAWSASPWTTPSCHQKMYAPPVTLSSHGFFGPLCASLTPLHAAMYCDRPSRGCLQAAMVQCCLPLCKKHVLLLSVVHLLNLKGMVSTLPCSCILPIFPSFPQSHLLASNVDQSCLLFSCLFADASLTAADSEAQSQHRG